jgi:hypothetical protein
MRTKTEQSCEFKKCELVKGPSIYCPRHAFLVEQFGVEKAEGMECGFTCPQCKAVSDAQCERCPHCEEVGCEVCRKGSKCCDKRIDDIENKARELEDEADSLRRSADRIEASRKKKVAA